jgi:hypothetical protein
LLEVESYKERCEACILQHGQEDKQPAYCHERIKEKEKVKKDADCCKDQSEQRRRFEIHGEFLASNSLRRSKGDEFYH